MSDDLSFLIDDSKVISKPNGFYKILIVDDEESVHTITKTALKNRVFFGKGLEILVALSAIEAKKVLCEHDDIALAIVDVVMETPNAGLDLINYIRSDLNNTKIRLVLRTGQANQAPEEQIIDKYDINDYKEKTELTIGKLYTLVRTSIKNYEQLRELEYSRDELYKKMTTSELTLLPNRMKLNEILDSSGKKSLIIININNFSKINKKFGFDIGDKFLIEFANFLKENYSSPMSVFHLHGDVFSIVYDDVEEDILKKRLKALKKSVANQNFMVGSERVSFRIRMGVALHELGNLIQKAELAMKQANSCDDNYIIYSDD